MGIKVNLTLFSLLTLVFSSVSVAQENKSLKNALENFTLSYCLAHSGLGETLQQEANAAVGAYVERGLYSADAYGEAADVAKRYLEKTYNSKDTNVDLTVMKCIDAAQSKEIDEIKNRYSDNH
ncbi:T6SS amidase immunity protein Tai4 family protein [Morganella psychrotolerans]|uniref:T6SS amidase immunity protein Tai4 family protein n=1 Tax=Morganella psychrotolerans TaxID=368603 RepID=UPI0039B0D434